VKVYNVGFENADSYGHSFTSWLDDTVAYATRELAQEVADSFNAQEESRERRQYEERVKQTKARRKEHEALVAAGLRKGEYVWREPQEVSFKPIYFVGEIDVIGTPEV
jgi:hypothetical protein